ncbi:hypothetical protein MRX96_003530 [Rhipicephalus microplus]
MDPRLHQGRREARVEALERTYAHKNTTYYVDAANYDHANNKAVVDHTLTERTSASVRCRNITDAEETAIALALALGYRQRRSLTVLTDSQAACRNYLQGRISQPALSVIMSIHFLEESFEQHRADGWRKLKPNAVPTLFPRNKPARGRKSPKLAAGAATTPGANDGSVPTEAPGRIRVGRGGGAHVAILQWQRPAYATEPRQGTAGQDKEDDAAKDCYAKTRRDERCAVKITLFKKSRVDELESTVEILRQCLRHRESEDLQPSP